ncbi:Na(+)-translocating NADH-quinone reductase subunit E [Acrasis kona]|uniref:Na(+)-translocating NADH-quinone reductase subunit E n=1 Tax=Acrasis kona TaxID=1008807 RepID=A0AAW2YXK6_9EUKA
MATNPKAKLPSIDFGKSVSGLFDSNKAKTEGGYKPLGDAPLKAHQISATRRPVYLNNGGLPYRLSFKGIMTKYSYTQKVKALAFWGPTVLLAAWYFIPHSNLYAGKIIDDVLGRGEKKK